MDFKGYEGKYKPSEISGKPRLFYDRNKPFTKNIKLFTTAVPTGYITIPKYYVIPQSQYRIIDEFKRNKIQMRPIQKDSTFTVESYKIKDLKPSKILMKVIICMRQRWMLPVKIRPFQQEIIWFQQISLE
jgi:hypothetical protein